MNFSSVDAWKTDLAVRLGNETVAHTAHSQEMARLPGMIFDIAPQADDEIINCASVGVFAQAPHIFQDRFPRYRAAVLANQMTQKLGFHQSKLDGVRLRAELQGIK